MARGYHIMHNDGPLHDGYMMMHAHHNVLNDGHFYDGYKIIYLVTY